ncbi:MAG: peptidase inhibitor I78 [Variovorax sp.]|nr:MAG: peptidase inhibitor I78 [Variovorax sp.]
MFSLAAMALVAACAAPAPAPPAAAAPASPPRNPPCNADAARFTVGQSFTPQLEAAARSRAGALTSRMLKPHQVTTMEFVEGRLNIDVDARNRVTSVRCG